MTRGRVLPHFHQVLDGTYKWLIIGAILAVSDFRGVLLHGCTGRRYKFHGTERVTPEESISLRGTANSHAGCTG
jgi:hypothetical protein